MTLCGLTNTVQYLVVESGPLIYAEFGLTDPSLNLIFLPFIIGVLLAIPCFYFQCRATIYMEEKHGKKNVPEHKLLWAFVAALIFPVSLYWFAWTSQPSINMYVSLVALGAFAFSSHIRESLVRDSLLRGNLILIQSISGGFGFHCRELWLNGQQRSYWSKFC